ncbi:MAG: CatA-like O-acetyltransferase [Oscillospiraceae bacterium]
MKIIDKTTWERTEVFDFFSGISHPFYSLSFPVDVTELYRYTKARGLSFYYSLVYLCTKAVNSVENMRYLIHEGQVALTEERSPSFTDMKKGSELFHIVTMPCRGSMAEFCAAAREKSAAQRSFLDQSAETGELIYFSCLPWLEITGLTNERDLDIDDAIPRISWGKFTERDGHKTLGMTVEVNHRFVDGVHVGRFYEALQGMIDALE